MKSKIVCLLLSFFITLPLFAQIQTDISKEGLKGSIKSVQMESYEAKRDESKPLKSIFLDTYYTNYSRSGQKENMNYSINSASLFYQANYKRDAYGNIILEIITDPSSTVLGKTFYNYNSKNQISEEVILSPYNELENLIHYIYSPSGLLLKKVYHDSGKNVIETYIFLYDHLNQLLKTQVNNPDGFKKKEVIYEYNDSGNPIVVNNFDYTLGDPSLKVDVFEYEFDEKGNWIKKYQYRMGKTDLIPYYIFERKIEYYK